MGQMSVTPAKTSPAPTNAEIAVNHGFTAAPSATPATTSEPAMIRIWRSSEIVALPRSTGRPAASHAFVPPSTFATSGNPAAANASRAFLPRAPLAQMTYKGFPGRPRDAITAAASNRSNGTDRAGVA